MGTPERRPGPFRQHPSRTLPTKEQRKEDYRPDQQETDERAKRQPATSPDGNTQGGVGSQGGM